MESESPNYDFKDRFFETGYDPVDKESRFLLDITLFSALLNCCFEAIGARQKQLAINRLLDSCEWVMLYQDKTSKCSVYAENAHMEHKHELNTASSLTQKGYDVLFAPKGMFKRADKKFDVFLIRNHVILKADLKTIISKNPETIANRIADGSQQANRIVVDVLSDVERRTLINGLRSGINRSFLLKEILLFYKNKFFRLTRDEICSKRIYYLLQN